MASYFLSKTAQQVDQVISDYYSKNTGNRFVLTTGDQTISGSKTFSSTSFTASADTIIIGKPYNFITFGEEATNIDIGGYGTTNIGYGGTVTIGSDTASINIYGVSMSIGSSNATNYIGQNAYTNVFGEAASTNSFGMNSPSNEFGSSFFDLGAIAYNSFGSNTAASSITSLFGANNIDYTPPSPYSLDFGGFGNVFGSDSLQNQYGCVTLNTYLYEGHINWFGTMSDYLGNTDTLLNYFGGVNPVSAYIAGAGETINYFGIRSFSNHFGLQANNNYYYTGEFMQPVKLRLNTFAGSKNQSGNVGDLRVSGTYLYICTGTNTWGRTLISTF